MPARRRSGRSRQRDQRGAVRREHGRRERVGEREERRDDRVGIQRQPPPRSSANTKRSVASTTPSRPSAYGRASRDASITPALAANARPATSPPSRPSSIVPRTTSSPAASATAIADGSPQRALVVPDGRRELEQQQLTGLPGIVVDDPRDHRAERALRLRERRRLVGRQRPVPERDDAERERAERDGHGCEAPGERRSVSRRVRQRRCPRSRLEATWRARATPVGSAASVGRRAGAARRISCRRPASAAWRCSLRNRSASSAAAHPEPAAVTACR